MSDTNDVQYNALTPQQTLQNIEQVRDLFARSHDYIAQATYPGHLGSKIAEVLNFLAFQYNDFKLRAEGLRKQIDSTVNVEAVLVAKPASDTLSDEHGSAEAPKAS